MTPKLFRCEGCGEWFPPTEVVDVGEPIRTLCQKCLPDFQREHPEEHELTPERN